ncbi:helix-turn-helix domain-containing protein [Streptomyces sp. MUM 178J]|uniref:helix-turn-helix domain-containing protein n=1 Tax=Streptomyces sp. MUM 178J TaxID=2791991 RepID=UPI001F03E874|nr:helix-turn-helix domain-containing protein [Streptomyces sp. MUM 178J]WRQ80874.1 ricin-type beta-trefoil lectin domain protein [Streptomyces sp. MUM 178J]
MAAEKQPQAAPAQRLGSALRALQQGSGRTLRSLEKEVLISDSSLSRYFRGSTVPPWATVRDLCRALGADPAEYRALWEAADRSQPRPEGGPGYPFAPPAVPDADADTDTGTDAGGPGAPRPRNRRRLAVGRIRLRRPRSRRAYAATGALAGLALGVVLALAALVLFAAPPATAPAAGSSAPGATAGENGAAGSTAGLPRTRRIFVSRATGRCLDDSLDEKLRTYKCNGMSYQWWTVHTLADGTHRLRNHATGRCLDDGSSGLRAVPCGSHAPASQTWSVTVWDDESVEVRSGVTRRCLDDSGSGLRTLACDRTSRQKWG